jgi:hypothetical protein
MQQTNATSRKVVGSIPDEVIRFFNWSKHSNHIWPCDQRSLWQKLAPGIFPGVKRGRPARKADNLTAICEPII